MAMFSTGCAHVERKNVHREVTACGAEKFSDTSFKVGIGLLGVGGDTTVFAGDYRGYGSYQRFSTVDPAYGSSVHPRGNPWAAAVATEAAMGGYVSSEPWWVREREQRRSQPVFSTSSEIEVIVTPANYQDQHWKNTQEAYGTSSHGGHRGNTYKSPHLPGQPPPRSGWQPHLSR